MLLYTASFGKYASHPLGWSVFLLVIIAEGIIMSQFLENKKFEARIMLPCCVSNIVSAVAGALLSKVVNNGWMLVVWFPWVSSVDIDLNNSESFITFVTTLVGAFIFTVIIEVILNWMMMKSRGFKRVMSATVLANVISYVVACFFLYAYSFNLYE
jgi:hypothetical protein